MQNPFKYGGIVSGPYFADRDEEIAELTREMKNNNRIFLISQRRFGKTCLLHHLKEKLEAAGTACAYIDLHAYPDLRSFAGGITSVATRALETNTDKLIKIFSGFHKMRPKIEISMHPDSVKAGIGVEFSVNEQEALAALVEGMAQIGTLAAKKKKRMAIIIDEFSDIAKYNGGTVEKALRSEIQKHDHIGYIFSGSEQSVMLSMIQDRHRAFYKMGRIMRLGPIKKEVYLRFISKWLAAGGYKANTGDLDRIFRIGKEVPYNIQRLCHTLWEAARESKTIDADLIATLPTVIARQDSAHYELIWQTTTQAQKVLLIALVEDPDTRPFSKAFQMKHGIGPSSSIKASLVSLLKKGIITKTPENRYRFVDTFMPYWIKAIRG